MYRGLYMAVKTFQDPISHWIILVLSWYIASLSQRLQKPKTGGKQWQFEELYIMWEKKGGFQISAVSCPGFCTCAVTILSVKERWVSEQLYMAFLIIHLFYLNHLLNHSPAFLLHVKIWKYMWFPTLGESSLVAEEIFLNFPKSVKLLRIYKILRQST